MTEKRFEGLVRNVIEEINNRVKNKGQEYARVDRLSNFKVAASMSKRRGETPEQALMGMLKKHWVSILDITDDTAEDKIADYTVWYEKCLDNIVYSICLLGLVMDREDSSDRPS